MNAIRSFCKQSLLLLATFSVAAQVATAATREVKVAKSGPVTAELSYQKDGYQYRNVRLKIVRAGKTLSDRTVPASEYDRPLTDGNFQVADLDGDKEPEVIVDFYTGGAHCCTYSLIYGYNSAKRQYSNIKQDWQNTGYKLRDLNGDRVPEFNSADNRFAYKFTAYAGSRFPVQIWQYRGGKMTDATRQFRQQIARDAAGWWKDFEEQRKNGIDSEGFNVKGILAAYLADKYMLGQGEEGWRQVRQAYQLRDREKFFSELQAFLKESGYIASNR